MGLLDILGGRDRNAQREPEEEAPAAAEPTTSSSSREMLRDPAASLGGFEPPNRYSSNPAAAASGACKCNLGHDHMYDEAAANATLGNHECNCITSTPVDSCNALVKWSAAGLCMPTTAATPESCATTAAHDAVESSQNIVQRSSL